MVKELSEKETKEKAEKWASRLAGAFGTLYFPAQMAMIAETNPQSALILFPSLVVSNALLLGMRPRDIAGKLVDALEWTYEEAHEFIDNIKKKHDILGRIREKLEEVI